MVPSPVRPQLLPLIMHPQAAANPAFTLWKHQDQLLLQAIVASLPDTVMPLLAATTPVCPLTDPPSNLHIPVATQTTTVVLRNQRNPITVPTNPLLLVSFVTSEVMWLASPFVRTETSKCPLFPVVSHTSLTNGNSEWPVDSAASDHLTSGIFFFFPV